MELPNLYLVLLLIPISILLTKLFTISTGINKNLPPSPPSLPILGHLHLLKKPLHRSLATLSLRYGPTLYLKFGSRPVLIVTSPSVAEECLTKNDIVFANRPLLLLGKHMGHNYTSLTWAPYGQTWRNLRRIASLEIFSSHRLQMFTSIRVDEVKCMIKTLFKRSSSDGSVDMKVVFSELALNVMMKMIAGKRYYGDTVEEEEVEKGKRFRELVKENFSLSGASNVVDFFPILKWVGFAGIERRIIKLTETSNKFLQELIEEKREQEKGAKTPTSTPCLIDVLLELQEKEPQHYTDQMIRGTIWVLLATGTDTSAGALEWALSLLVNHPEIIKKAQKEIDTNVGKGRLLQESDLLDFPFLHRIIVETLRMFPGAPLLAPHQSSEECTVSGYHIPHGTMLLVNMWAIQNDPKLWVEPNTFNPARFEGVDGVRDGFKMMPFGSGRRGCPGESLAIRLIGLSLGTLLQCFDWERITEEMVDMTEGHGLSMPKVHALKVKCTPRSMISTVLSHL